jgi:phospholipid/cholesterol/gamma-HCH transport system substrate-binding protein
MGNDVLITGPNNVLDKKAQEDLGKSLSELSATWSSSTKLH